MSEKKLTTNELIEALKEEGINVTSRMIRSYREKHLIPYTVELTSAKDGTCSYYPIEAIEIIRAIRVSKAKDGKINKKTKEAIEEIASDVLLNKERERAQSMFTIYKIQLISEDLSLESKKRWEEAIRLADKFDQVEAHRQLTGVLERKIRSNLGSLIRGIDIMYQLDMIEEVDEIVELINLLIRKLDLVKPSKDAHQAHS